MKKMFKNKAFLIIFVLMIISSLAVAGYIYNLNQRQQIVTGLLEFTLDDFEWEKHDGDEWVAYTEDPLEVMPEDRFRGSIVTEQNVGTEYKFEIDIVDESGNSLTADNELGDYLYVETVKQGTGDGTDAEVVDWGEEFSIDPGVTTLNELAGQESIQYDLSTEGDEAPVYFEIEFEKEDLATLQDADNSDDYDAIISNNAGIHFEVNYHIQEVE